MPVGRGTLFASACRALVLQGVQVRDTENVWNSDLLQVSKAWGLVCPRQIVFIRCNVLEVDDDARGVPRVYIPRRKTRLMSEYPLALRFEEFCEMNID